MVYNDTYKFVVVVNKNLEIGKSMNAIAHSYAELVGVAPKGLKDEFYRFRG